MNNDVCFVVHVCGEPKYWDMAAYSMSTFHKYLTDVDFAVLYFGDIPDTDGVKFLKTIVPEENFIKNINIEKKCKEIFSYHYQGDFSPIVLSRLFFPVIPELKRYRRIIGFDSDMEAVNNLDNLKTIRLPTGIGGVVDLAWTSWAHRRAERSVPDKWFGDGNPYGKKGDLSELYYNGGLIIFDRSTLPVDYEERIRFALDADSEIVFPWLEQDMFNLVMDFSPNIPRNYNIIFQYRDQYDTQRILHYVGKENKDKYYLPKVHTFFSDKHRKKIVVYAIAKNESKFVDRWMDSMSESDGVYVLDTGSTDDTVEKLRARGAIVETMKYEPWKTLEEYDRIISEGKTPWRFDEPRNHSMAMCPSDTDIFVCTDLDEVLEKGWRRKLEKAWVPGTTLCRYDYIWSFKTDGTPERKFKYEKIHGPGYEWRYPVHELLFRKDNKDSVYIDTDILLEHHPDLSKSRSDYFQYLQLSVREDQSNDRNAHYLAREYSYRGLWREAIKYHLIYLGMKSGWSAERALSMRFLGQAFRNLEEPDMAELWYRRGMEEDKTHRECAFEYAKWMYSKQNWKALKTACLFMLNTTTPTNDYVTERSCWGWEPYDWLGLSLWYTGDRKGAISVYKESVKKFPNNKHLQDNLKNCGG